MSQLDTFSPRGLYRGMISINRNHHGNLRLRLYWDGLSSTEGTSLKDSPENRERLKPMVDKINAEMAAGTFDYLKHFPHGNKAEYFKKAKTDAQPKTIRSYYIEWITLFALHKKTRLRIYKSNFEVHILPLHGDCLLSAYGVSEIRAALHDLCTVKGLSVKTAKNVLNGSLRALFRDAHSEGLIERNPFSLLPKRWWPRYQSPTPDPFEESERDEILAYMKKKLIPGWPQGYAFVYTLFWTGMRPSELTARRWRDLDLRTGKLSITTSRVEGEEGATKTSGSNRTIELFPSVLELLRSIKPLRVEPDDYIITNRSGKEPMDQHYFGQRIFQAALAVLELKHRDFYHTRHTFISAMLSHDENLQQVSEYVGNSPEMIVQHYGKYIGKKGTFGQAAMNAGNEAQKERMAK